MAERVVLYARVSTESQGERVSINQQTADMQALCERSDWEILGEFVDCENYKATQAPKRGQIVNPSGERADRPQFLQMLELVRSGGVDVVVCWRDDRLVRHPRVAVALEDALDLGDAERSGKTKIQIRDATGATIDRFTLSIKATIWREENKRRAERVNLGKMGTLKEGRWPSVYVRLGYSSKREPGKRGRVIELGPDEEVEAVRLIYKWYDAGLNLQEIRRQLIKRGISQKGRPFQRLQWGKGIINEVLRSEAYTGKAVWTFKDGTTYEIEIPAIIDRDLWQRCQRRRERNKQLATRHAKGVYVLQGLVYCGECRRKLRTHCAPYTYATRKDGRRKKYPRYYDYVYRCEHAKFYRELDHASPWIWNGRKLDAAVWRKLADEVIKRPDMVRDQILAKQAELQAQGDSVDGDIAHARQRLVEIDQQRTNYSRQQAKGLIDWDEFEQRMAETDDNRQFWQDELFRLQELRDNAEGVRAGLDYVSELMGQFQTAIPAIDHSPEEMRALSKEDRDAVQRERRKIVRALVEKVYVCADGRVQVEGVIEPMPEYESGCPWPSRPLPAAPGSSPPRSGPR
jgi:DNA invertase Pin-like site-specific DNA recombinase